MIKGKFTYQNIYKSEKLVLENVSEITIINTGALTINVLGLKLPQNAIHIIANHTAIDLVLNIDSESPADTKAFISYIQHQPK